MTRTGVFGGHFDRVRLWTRLSDDVPIRVLRIGRFARSSTARFIEGLVSREWRDLPSPQGRSDSP